MRFPVAMMVLLYMMSVFCDVYIYADIRCYARNKRLWSRVYAISSILLWIFITVVVCQPIRSQDDSILPVMWMLYSYLTVYLSKLVYVFFSLLGRLPVLWHRRRVNTGLWLGLPLGILTLIVMWWGVCFTRHEIQVNKLEILSDKLPESFDGYRIVQFSDAHVGTWGTDTVFISRLVDSINAQHPDIIVFTGDLVNRETRELEPFLKVLRRLNAPDGVISVLGNHDYGDYVDWRHASEREMNNALLCAWQRQMGWKMLNNEHAFLIRENDSIVMIGVENWGEPPFKQYGHIEKAYPMDSISSKNHLNDNRFKILLTHNPEHWNQETYANTNIDLTLSGHTHAMQLMLDFDSWRWSPAQYKYEQWGGLYERLNNRGEPVRIYVNIGSGEVAMPFRIGAVPEVTVLVLKSGRVSLSGKDS